MCVGALGVTWSMTPHPHRGVRGGVAVDTCYGKQPVAMTSPLIWVMMVGGVVPVYTIA